MTTRRSTIRLTSIAALSALALLGGCTKPKPPANTLDAMDNRLVNGAAVAETSSKSVLAGDISVDPAKAGTRQPGDRAATVSLAQAVVRQRAGQPAMPAVTENGEGSIVGGGEGCLSGLVYANGWASKLPADLPMHPSARLIEAAGHDGTCRARVVTFTVPGDRGQVIGWYEGKARAAGYGASRADRGDDWVLTGERGSSSYIVFAGPPAGGATPIDLVWTDSD